MPTTKETEAILTAMFPGTRWPTAGGIRWFVRADGKTVLQQSWLPPNPQQGEIRWLDVPTDVVP